MPKIFLRLFRLSFSLGLALAVAWSLGTQPPLAAQSPGSQKILVDAADQETLTQLANSGAELLVEYEAFSLWRVAPGQAARVRHQGALQSQPDFDLIFLRGGQQIDTRLKEPEPSVAANLRQQDSQGAEMGLVQFIGPIKDEWLAALTKFGLEVVSYLPHNAYVVWGESARAKLRQLAGENKFIQWIGPYQPAYRLEPSLRQAAAARQAAELIPVTVQFYTTGQTQQSRQRLQTLAGTPWRSMSILNFTNVTLPLPAGKLIEVANWPDVFNIEPWVTPQLFDERQDQIIAGNISGNGPSAPGYLNWLASKGFTQTNQFDFVVDISDSGLDNGGALPNHFGLYELGNFARPSRVVYNRLEGTPHANSTLNGVDGHGTINAHIVAGYNNLSGFPHTDSAGFHYGLGVAPFVKVGSSVIFDPSTFTFPNYANLQARAYQAGARLSNNSWGAAVAGAYTSDSQAYDALVRDAQPVNSAFAAAGNQEMVIIFSAGNSGADAGTIGSPGTAKNVLTVGAAENTHGFSGADRCGIDDFGANSLNDIIDFSSRGPTQDGRKKPDLVAPGTHITGGVFQQNPLDTGNGVAHPSYNGNGVCGGVSSAFFPNGQQFYTASSGTSHSAPAVAGGAALLRQHFINQGLTPPSPAMTKAYLLNAGQYLTGQGANDTLFSNSQGMGSLNLGVAFDGVARRMVDQSVLFSNTGQIYVASGNVISNARPFRVTLAWTDAPGSTTGSAFVNDLDLEVVVGGNTYKGNIFNGAASTGGGTADARDNVESVFVPAGVSGAYAVRVVAKNLAGDGVPGNADTTDQDFALVIYNGNTTLQPALTVTGVNTSDSGASNNSNGAVEPGETISLNIGLTNVGDAVASNVNGRVSVTGGNATMLNAASAYANIAPGATITNSIPYSFRVSPAQPCGQPLSFAFNGTYNAGTVNHNFTLLTGLSITPLTQNFDGVVPPALPVNWSAANNSGPLPLWVATSATPDTTPNAVFVNDPPVVSDKQLTSPLIQIQTNSAQLSFRNRYNLESAYDGGVLEISVNSGPFADIITAGGSFASGGYNNLISSSFGNPLIVTPGVSRPAWTGNSGGYITTVVNLPPAAAGQTIQLRWRMGSDSSLSGEGQWVDTISVKDGFSCAPLQLSTSLYLPLLGNEATMAPDLVIETLTAATGGVTVVIKNVGSAPVTDAFWVDVYLNPNPVLSHVNQTWPHLASEGLVWGVTQPIPVNGTLALTIGDAFYSTFYSRFSGTIAANTPVWAQVDSVNLNSSYGGVLESHEIINGSYNNISGPIFTTNNNAIPLSMSQAQPALIISANPPVR
ncbi:MAG: S8 family serine peptidase [Anaerolineae bacterium]